MFFLLYADEVENGNPLGAKRGSHKLRLVYCSVLNIHPRYRSQLRGIYLLLIAKYKDVYKYGMDKVLYPLNHDLQRLKDQGFMFQMDRGMVRTEVVVVAMYGDKLSMHSIGGFSNSFAWGRVCCLCMAHEDALQKIIDEAMCVLREKHTHLKHVAAVAVNSDLKRLYGVRGASPFFRFYRWNTFQFAKNCRRMSCMPFLVHNRSCAEASYHWSCE